MLEIPAGPPGAFGGHLEMEAKSWGHLDNPIGLSSTPDDAGLDGLKTRQLQLHFGKSASFNLAFHTAIKSTEVPDKGRGI